MASHQDATRALASTVTNVALAYAGCKVCFDAWDATLDLAGEKLLRYSRWPLALRLLLHALYPAYFVYSSAKRLSGPEGPRDPAEVRRWALLLGLACAAVGVRGLRDGRAALRQRPASASMDEPMCSALAGLGLGVGPGR